MIIQSVFSTQHLIASWGGSAETGYENPPLSHLSDMAFLDYMRACETHQADVENLRHIFISVVTARQLQSVVKEIFEQRRRPIQNFDELPRWAERVCLSPNIHLGQAIMGTVQLQGIVWMLLQHRQQLGWKTVRQVCIFKDTDENQPGRGPSIYVELENVRR